MLFDDPTLQALKKQFNKEKVRKEGYVKAMDRGFGFLEAEKEAVFIAPDDMRRLIHGDKISAFLETDYDGRNRAVPETLIDPFLKRFVARTVLSQGKLFVIPDHPNIHTRIPADDRRTDKSAKIASGDWVVCTLTRHALRDQVFRADLTEYICSKDDPKVPWSVSLRRFDLPLQEPEGSDFKFLESDLPREDMRSLCFITIDGPHTQDMDDALYIEKQGDKFLLYVAIADPSGYIHEDSPLDAIAAKRAFSVYLPGRDIPMLPRLLSDNLCSLREGEDRPVLTGIFTIAADGNPEIDKSIFKLAVINSHGRLCYNDISDYLEGKETSFHPSAEIDGVLRLLEEFTRVRSAYRNEHASPFRNRPDYDFILNEDGALDHIEVNVRRIANMIVEESMIAANMAAGSMLAEKLGCGIFNAHSGFDTKKKDELLKILEEENCPCNQEALDTIEGYNEVRRYISKSGNTYLDARIRKLQGYSQISIKPAAHFALGVNNYATWTSPIRKYGDIINHRLLKSLILHTPNPKMPDDACIAGMNNARRTNRMAERDTREWLYVEYLEKDIEKKTEFTAEIFDISRGGMRLCLLENGAMVFMPAVYISTDKEALTLDGERGELLVNGKCVLHLSDTLKVKLISADLEHRTLTAAPCAGIGGLILPDPYAQRDARLSIRAAATQRNGAPRQSRGENRPKFPAPRKHQA